MMLAMMTCIVRSRLTCPTIAMSLSSIRCNDASVLVTINSICSSHSIYSSRFVGRIDCCSFDSDENRVLALRE